MKEKEKEEGGRIEWKREINSRNKINKYYKEIMEESMKGKEIK